MPRFLIVAGAALALASCGGESAPGNDGGGQIKIANPGHDQLMRLSPPMQKLGLMRAIRDTRNQCKRVDAAAFQQDYRGMAMWVAACSNTGAWAVFIAPNGDLQVRDCDHAAQLGLPQCRIPAAEAAPAAKSS